MNYISNIFGYFYNTIFAQSIKEDKPSEETYEDLSSTEPIIIEGQPKYTDIQINEVNDIIYIFINTANIYRATELMLEKINNYNNKYIKIYLLKSHKLEPLFKDKLLVNNINIELIKTKLSKRRRHLHTFIDAIDSFIEYNNIRNYIIYY